MRLPIVIDRQEQRQAEVLNDLLPRTAGTPLDITSVSFALSGYGLIPDGLHQVGASGCWEWSRR